MCSAKRCDQVDERIGACGMIDQVFTHSSPRPKVPAAVTRYPHLEAREHGAPSCVLNPFAAAYTSSFSCCSSDGSATQAVGPPPVAV